VRLRGLLDRTARRLGAIIAAVDRPCRRLLRTYALILSVTLVSGACGGGAGEPRPATTTSRPGGQGTSGPGAPVVAVLQETLERAAAERLSAPEIARLTAYVGLAGAQAVTLAAPRAMDFTALTDYPLPTEVPRGPVDGTTAAVAAMTAAARALLTDPASQVAVGDLGRRLLAARAARLDRPAITERSLAWGRHVGENTATWAGTDGYADLARRARWSPPDGPGTWEPTPPGRRPALLPTWGTLRGFVADVAACGVTPPLEVDTRSGTRYAAELRRLFLASRQRDAAAEATARFWDDERAGTPGPAGHWLAIAARLALDRRLDADAAARLLAVTATAIADAYLVAWRQKYFWARPRPVTMIRAVGWDRRFDPYLITPPTPEYPSAHAMVAGAAATVLAHTFGDRTRFTDPGQPGASTRTGPIRSRRFPGFGAAARQAARSRFLGEVNLAHTVEASYRLGRCLALQTGGRLDGVRDRVADPDALFGPGPGL